MVIQAHGVRHQEVEDTHNKTAILLEPPAPAEGYNLTVGDYINIPQELTVEGEVTKWSEPMGWFIDLYPATYQITKIGEPKGYAHLAFYYTDRGMTSDKHGFLVPAKRLENLIRIGEIWYTRQPPAPPNKSPISLDAPVPPREVKLVDYDQRGWHYGDRVKIKSGGGMSEFYGKTGSVISAEGEYLRIKLDEPVMVKGVGMVSDDLWMPSLLTKIKAPAPPEGGRTPGKWYARVINNHWVITSDIGPIVWLAKIGKNERLNKMNEANAHFIAECANRTPHSLGSAPPIALSAAEKAIPGYAEDLESCVLQVKGKKGSKNPFAVCRSSLKKVHNL